MGHPFDTTKVKLQTSNEFKSALDCVKQTLAKEGVRGLYRGMLTPLIFVTPLFATCFWGFEMGLKLIAYGKGMKTDESFTLVDNCVAGGFSALPATVLMTPIERVKVLLQTQKVDPTTGKRPFVGPVDVVRHLYKTGGVSSIYRGTVATLVRDGPGSVAYFGVYEYLKKNMTKNGEISQGSILFAGGMAGVANWAVSIPPDVLKSRLQAAPEGMYKGMGDVFFKLIKEEGPQGLFKGFVPIMARAFPANAACFFGAELSYKFLDKLW